MSNEKLAEALRDSTFVAAMLDAICETDGTVDRMRARDAACRVREALQAHAAEAAQAYGMEDIRGAVARGWCAPLNERKVMDADLAEAITREVSAMLAAAPQQAAEPVAVVECNANGQIRLATPSGDAFDMSRYVGARFYTHPQPAQDAKDEATIEHVARAIYEHVFTMSIPRMGVRSATFEEVWAIPSERERLTAQACAAIDTAMAKESGR